jgi:uncharacterized membrane protein YoaK (UPF0700 family)
MIILQWLAYRDNSHSLRDYKSLLGIYFFLSWICLITGAFFSASLSVFLFDFSPNAILATANLVVYLIVYVALYFYFFKKIEKATTNKP